MSLADRIAAGQAFDATRFVPFRLDGEPVGWVRRDHLAALQPFPDVVRVSAAGVDVHPRLDTPAARDAAFADMLARLRDDGYLGGWRNELYAVRGELDDPVRFRIERAAARLFGIRSHAVHVNGYSGRGTARTMWLARRSPVKPIDPGMLDNMVGGGLAANLSIAETLVKEGWEEAGLAAEVMRGAQPNGTFSVMRESREGLQWQRVHVYEVDLPDCVVPRNTDGEVAGFEAVALPAVRARIEGDADFTVDAALVAIRGLLREGVLGAAELGPGHVRRAVFDKD